MEINNKKVAWNKGISPSLETRQKLSKSLKGKQCPQRGQKRIGTHQSIETRQKISQANLGRKLTEEQKNKISKTKLGKHFPKMSESRKGILHTKEHNEKIRKSLLGKFSGPKHPNWKGGITSKNKLIRNSIEYKLWLKTCMERDSFTCQKYYIKGGKLVVHHVFNFSNFPELRFNIKNGITLSVKAHKEFHKIYGRKNNTREQLEEFLQKGSLEEFLKDGKENNYYEVEE